MDMTGTNFWMDIFDNSEIGDLANSYAIKAKVFKVASTLWWFCRVLYL